MLVSDHARHSSPPDLFGTAVRVAARACPPSDPPARSFFHNLRVALVISSDTPTTVLGIPGRADQRTVVGSPGGEHLCRWAAEGYGWFRSFRRACPAVRRARYTGAG